MKKPITVKTRNITVVDKDIVKIINSTKAKYIHYYAYKEECGSVCIIAKKPPENEMTVSPWYHLIKKYDDKFIVSIPKYLKEHVGKKVICYIECVDPDEDELFRIQAEGFILETDRIKSTIKKGNNFPYISNGGKVIIPKPYINMVFNEMPNDVYLSFNSTMKKTLIEGYIFMHIIGRKRIINGEDAYPLRLISNKLKTFKIKMFIEFLKQYGKNIADYKYATTINYGPGKYGMIVFKEVG